MAKGTVMRMLSSPRLALVLLALLALYAGVAAWLPWGGSALAPVPSWAVRTGFDHPFNAVPFLVLVLLLFVNTLTCTVYRFRATLRLYRGELSERFISVTVTELRKGDELLLEAGFHGRQGVWYRYRPALWGGFIFHLGILLLILSTVVQQSFHDSGSFELAEGEAVRLDSPGALFDVIRGRFASKTAPALLVALDKFDPFLHQEGYAPDRRSRLVIREVAGGREHVAEIDRARGVKVGDCYLYQAIPTGYVLKITLREMGERAFHLRRHDERSAAGEFTAPGGEKVRFVLQAEKKLSDFGMDGSLRVRIESPSGGSWLLPGETFSFGTVQARLEGISRWGGFTYARSPGVAGVFTGFAVILAGCLLLLFPAGVARMSESSDKTIINIWLARRSELFLSAPEFTAGAESSLKEDA